MRTAFDKAPRHQAPNIFVSEYAVTTGGGRGNLLVRLPLPRPPTLTVACARCLSSRSNPKCFRAKFSAVWCATEWQVGLEDCKLEK